MLLRKGEDLLLGERAEIEDVETVNGGIEAEDDVAQFISRIERSDRAFQRARGKAKVKAMILGDANMAALAEEMKGPIHALTLDVFLTIADALHAQAADNVTLTVGGIDLIIAEALHAHAADNLAFTLDTFLAVADALHAQTADNLTLSLGGALSDAEFRQMYDWLQDLYGRQLLTVGTFLALK